MITDLVMPDVGGAALREATSDWELRPAFLMATGYSPRDVAGGVPDGDGPVLRKPWNATDLGEAVREALEGLRRCVSQFLRRAGHQVDEAANGLPAMRILEDHPVDLVLTDLNMPEMNGIELLIELTTRGHDARIIAMSGGGLVAAQELIAVAHLLGAVDVLRKPFSLPQLFEKVATALED